MRQFACRNHKENQPILDSSSNENKYFPFKIFNKALFASNNINQLNAFKETNFIHKLSDNYPHGSRINGFGGGKLRSGSRLKLDKIFEYYNGNEKAPMFKNLKKISHLESENDICYLNNKSYHSIITDTIKKMCQQVYKEATIIASSSFPGNEQDLFMEQGMLVHYSLLR